MNTQVLSKTSRVLIVDDSQPTLKLMGSVFAEHGFVTALAKSVAEARALLNTATVPFDLVVSDIAMPVETGFDLLKCLKSPESPDKEVPVLLVTSAMPDAHFRILGLSLGAVDYVTRPEDLTELVLRSTHAIEHYRQVRTLQAHLEDSENLAMVGRLLAGANHEIKNLACLVQLSVQALGSPHPAPGAHERLRKTTDLLVEVVRSSASLLSGAPARLESLAVAPLAADLKDLVLSHVNTIFFENTVPATSPLWIKGNATGIKQILINFVLNAVDAVREFNPDAGGRIALAAVVQGARVELTVSDNGIGFTQATERREFEPFQTTKKMRGGQGLGLWLAARVAKTMDATILLRSAGPGRGATAVLSLPIAEPATKEDLSRYFIM